MGFTDADYRDTRRPRRHRHVTPPTLPTPPAVGSTMTSGTTPPTEPETGDLWWDVAESRMLTWNGTDWLTVVTGGPTAPTPPSFPRPDPTMPPGSMVLVVDGALSDADGRDPELVTAYRERMMATAERWAAHHGFAVARGSWSSLPPVDRFIDVPIRLETYLVPLTDGVWGEIWAARAEDAADRAAEDPTVPTPVPAPIVRHIEPDGS